MTTFDALLRQLHHIHKQELIRAQQLHIPFYRFAIMCSIDVNLMFDTWRDIYMAKNGKTKSEGYGDTWFANIRLGASDRAVYENWLQGATEAQTEVIAGIILDGWKLTLSFNSETDGFIAAATQKDSKNVNFGAVVTSFSGDWYDAMMTTAYKIIQVIGDDKIANESEGSRWG